MSGDPKNPVVGDFVFNGEEFVAYAVDLPPGGCQGMLTTREGFLDVCQELVTQQGEWGAKAGISDQEVADLATTSERIARIDVFLPAMLKAVEVLTETRYMLDDQRQRILLDAAQSVDRRAGRQPELLARYEKTREYRSAIAKKALKTKEKHAEQAKGKSPDTQPEAATPATSATSTAP